MMTDKEIRCAIEAILFANGSSVSAHQLSQAIDVGEPKIKEQCDVLIEEYQTMERGITIIKLNKSFQMVTVKMFAEYVRKAMDLRRNIPLSQAALEVLAVVAYNQPVTKSFIEQVRGVDCSGVIGSLTTKDLIEEKGRLELPGRPLLYGTTENFLRCFSLSSVEDLPTLPANGDDEKNNIKKTGEKQLSLFEKDSKKIEEGTEEGAEKGAEPEEGHKEGTEAEEGYKEGTEDQENSKELQAPASDGNN